MSFTKKRDESMPAIQQLKEQHNEAQLRCDAAHSSSNEALKRLNETLASGQDTSQIRQVLKKCQELAKEAESQKQAVESQIKAYYNAEDNHRASEIVSGIQSNIQQLLTPFDLTKYQNTEVSL